MTKETCILSFMRCNPIHHGHGLVFEKAQALQEQYNADLKIFLSTSTDNIKNPLPPELKMYYTEGFYPSVQENIYTEDNLFDIMRELDGKYLDVFLYVVQTVLILFRKHLTVTMGSCIIFVI